MPTEKVSKNELERIFKDYYKRSTFISEYPHFGNDNNDDFYLDFINAYITSKKYKMQEDAIELSLATNHFDMMYLDVVSKIIHSGRASWIKLLCLDWLNYFVLNIPAEEYTNLNYFAKMNSDDFLKLQSILNLVQLNPKPELLEESFEILKDTNSPTLYYRYLNAITNTDNNFTTVLPNVFTEKLRILLNKSEVINENQKADLQVKLLIYSTLVKY